MRQADCQRRSVRTRTFGSLVSEWDQLSRSAVYRRQLRVWRELEPDLGSCWDGRCVVDLGLSTDQDEACGVLSALARLAQKEHGDGRVDSDLAARSALQILLPRLVRLCGRGNGWVEFDELVCLVLSFAWEALLSLPPGFRCDSQGRRTDVVCSTPYDFRLWSNIKSRLDTAINRRVKVCKNEIDCDEFSDLGDDSDFSATSVEVLSLWVAQIASVSKAAADLVVLSRTGVASVEELAGADSLESVWKRRQRSEAKFKAGLAA